MATSLAAFLLCLFSFANAQPFGRFGYVDVPQIPGLTIDREGFAVKFGASDKFLFSSPASGWTVRNVTDAGEEIDLGKGSGPSSVRIDLLAPGMMIRFPRFGLNLHSTSAPYLSWKEGSVGEHVPTPNLRWALVSFKDNQPPIVLGFMDGEVSMQVDGKVGDWSLRTVKPYAGWVRVALPIGTRPFATNSAATLGELSSKAAKSDELWWQPTPVVKSLDIVDEDTAVEATWTFDRKNSIVPVAAALARLGMYPITIKSQTHRLDGFTEEGPVTVCDDATLTLRLPVRRIPLGRGLSVGASDPSPISTVSAFDLSGVVELAMENLTAGRDLSSRKLASEAVDSFIQDSTYNVEPHTGLRLPYPPDGRGVDVVAANALLYGAYSASSRASSEENALLTSLRWRMDRYTWRLWGADVRSSRRAGALAALAGALCPEPERRLDAAMFQAALAAERGLGIYLSRAAGAAQEPTYLEPMWTLRNSLFFMEQSPRHPSEFAGSLLGEIRVFGDQPVRCSTGEGGSISIVWTGPSVHLVSPFPIGVEGTGLTVRSVLGNTVISADGPGEHAATLRLPAWARAIPTSIAPPRYDEPIN